MMDAGTPPSRRQPSPLDFLSYRPPRRSPMNASFFAPSDVSGAALLSLAAAVAVDVASLGSPFFHRRSAKHLSLSASSFAVILHSLLSVGARWSPVTPVVRSAELAVRELYVVLHRAKLLLAEVVGARRAWILVRLLPLAEAFQDADSELSVVLDVLAPAAAELGIPVDGAEALQLLFRRCRPRSRASYIDADDIAVRDELLGFVTSFGNGETPDVEKLRPFVIAGLGIADAATLQWEIELLEEQVVLQDAAAATLQLYGGVVALLRYCRLTVFDPEAAEVPARRMTKRLSVSFVGSEGSSETMLVPKEFICPISLELMRDPVVVSTGQTYDRPSIVQWIEEGHRTCPNSGLKLADDHLVPNSTLRDLIADFCAVYDFPCRWHEGFDRVSDNVRTAYGGDAAGEANRATARILVGLLKDGPSDNAKAAAAHEIRMLAKIGVDNRAYIAKLGAVPLLCHLLSSDIVAAQENAVTALLNLSIHTGNRALILQEEGSLELIVRVLRYGRTTEARENAAAVLFSLSVVHEYKKLIFEAQGAVEELARMLRTGTLRGKKDAALALFNLSVHPESWNKMLDAGAVGALVAALGSDLASEESAAALGVLMKHGSVTQAVAGSASVVQDLMTLLRRGTPKGQENAVAVLYEMCRRGGTLIVQRISKMQGLVPALQKILAGGTARAKKKASVVLRACQRAEYALPTAAEAASSLPPPLVDGAGTSGGAQRTASYERLDAAVAASSATRSVPVP